MKNFEIFFMRGAVCSKFFFGGGVVNQIFRLECGSRFPHVPQRRSLAKLFILGLHVYDVCTKLAREGPPLSKIWNNLWRVQERVEQLGRRSDERVSNVLCREGESPKIMRGCAEGMLKIDPKSLEWRFLKIVPKIRTIVTNYTVNSGIHRFQPSRFDR